MFLESKYANKSFLLRLPLFAKSSNPLFISELHKLYTEASKGNKQAGVQLSSACKLIGLFTKDLKSWNENKSKKFFSEDEVEKLIKEKKN